MKKKRKQLFERPVTFPEYLARVNAPMNVWQIFMGLASLDMDYDEWNEFIRKYNRYL